MKTNTLLTVFFLLISINTFSQPIWTKVLDAQNHNKSTSIGNTLLNDSIILQVGYIGHGGYFLPSYVLNSLLAYDLHGNILWHVEGLNQDSKNICSEKLTVERLNGSKSEKSPTYSPGGLFELVSANSDQIYAVGYYHDYWFEGFLTISKFDNNGDLITQNKHFWENTEDFESKKPVTMDVYEGNKILIGLYDNTVVKTDAFEQVSWLKIYEFNIKQVGFINENRFFIRASQNLYLADREGNIMDSVEFDDECLNSKVHNDTVYQLFSDKLIALDSDLNILDTIYITQDISLKSIKSFHDNLWLMGLKDQEIKMIKIENNTASEPLTFDLYIESPDFLISASRFIFTGTSQSGQMAVYSYDIEEEEPESCIWANIEIVDFNISNIEHEYIDNDPYDPIAIAFEYDTEITIYNNSDDIIESFAVFTYLMKVGVEGFKPFFYEKYTDCIINPYEEITINLPRMKKEDPPSDNNEFCFEILAPNSKIEPDISKNTLCKTFDVVGTGDFYHINSIIVYPNPTSNHLYVNLGKEGFSITTLKDINGRKIYEKTSNHSEIILNISTLKSGVYILTIIANNEQITKKIIKK